jgi:hypothetical protein
MIPGLVSTLNVHRWAAALFSMVLAVGICVHGDFGITWDEEYQYGYGERIHHYVYYDDESLLDYPSRYHGPVFQFVLYKAEKLIGIDDVGDVYRFRHLLTFLFAVVGSLFFYGLLLMVFRRRSLALLGVSLLLLSPRILSHSFYNSKDAVFMYMFIIAMYTMLRVLKALNWRTVTFHAVICALLIDVRILGVFVPAITVLLLLPRLLYSGKMAAFRLVTLGAWFGIVLLAGVVAFWPTLWHDPLSELVNAFTRMSAYPWDDEVRFMGRFLTPDQLPWYYLPWWVIISVPLLHLVLMLVGLATWFNRNGMASEHRWAVLLWLLLPLSTIIGKGAVVYDGWRHLFFIYPALVLMAVSGVHFVFRKLEVVAPSLLLWLTLALPLGWLTVWVVRNHPHQCVYFNTLAVKDAWYNYEMDYWGGSYKQALEWLVANRPEGNISICTTHLPGVLNQHMLPAQERARLIATQLEYADYLISNHRYPREFDPFIEGRFPYHRPIYQISVDGNVIVGVYDLKR